MTYPAEFYGGDAKLFHAHASRVHDHFPDGGLSFALFSTPYPETRDFEVPVERYLENWLPECLEGILPAMNEHAVIMQNIWFPRTEEGWYDERIFLIPLIYREYGLRMISPHPWDQKNKPPSGNHGRYDYSEFEFLFTFAKGPDYTYHKYRQPYRKKTVDKALSGNMRKASLTGTHAGGHAELHPEGAAQSDIYRFSPTGGPEVYRPRIEDGVFPMALAARAIHQYSNPGDTIIDPYCGSGTTLVEGILAGRKVVGFDTSIKNLRVAAKWLEDIAEDVAW
jgi:hypothetical protein